MSDAYVDGRDRDATAEALTALARIAERCEADGRRGDVVLFVDELHRVESDPELGELVRRIAVAGRKSGIGVRDALPRMRQSIPTLAEFGSGA